MHDKPVAEQDGRFSEPSVAQIPCLKCLSQASVTVRCWDSSCGGYTDYKFTCQACRHTWWVDGIDS